MGGTHRGRLGEASLPFANRQFHPPKHPFSPFFAIFDPFFAIFSHFRPFSAILPRFGSFPPILPPPPKKTASRPHFPHRHSAARPHLWRVSAKGRDASPRRPWPVPAYGTGHRKNGLKACALSIKHRLPRKLPSNFSYAVPRMGGTHRGRLGEASLPFATRQFHPKNCLTASLSPPPTCQQGQSGQQGHSPASPQCRPPPPMARQRPTKHQAPAAQRRRVSAQPSTKHQAPAAQRRRGVAPSRPARNPPKKNCLNLIIFHITT